MLKSLLLIVSLFIFQTLIYGQKKSLERITVFPPHQKDAQLFDYKNPNSIAATYFHDIQRLYLDPDTLERTYSDNFIFNESYLDSLIITMQKPFKYPVNSDYQSLNNITYKGIKHASVERFFQQRFTILLYENFDTVYNIYRSSKIDIVDFIDGNMVPIFTAFDLKNQFYETLFDSTFHFSQEITAVENNYYHKYLFNTSIIMQNMEQRIRKISITEIPETNIDLFSTLNSLINQKKTTAYQQNPSFETLKNNFIYYDLLYYPLTSIINMEDSLIFDDKTGYSMGVYTRDDYPITPNEISGAYVYEVENTSASSNAKQFIPVAFMFTYSIKEPVFEEFVMNDFWMDISAIKEAKNIIPPIYYNFLMDTSHANIGEIVVEAKGIKLD